MKKKISFANKPKQPDFKKAGWKAKNRGSKFKFFNKFKSNSGGWRFKNRFEKKGRALSPRPFNKNNFFFKKKRSYGRRPFFRWREGPFDKLALKKFSTLVYFFFKRNVGPSKKLVMTNYWFDVAKFVEPGFTFSYTQSDEIFYFGVIRSYIKAIKNFITLFLKELGRNFRSGKMSSAVILRGYYGAYKVFNLIRYLSQIYEQPLGKPDYYFRGYRFFLKLSFYRYLTIFCTKAFILTNKLFAPKHAQISDQKSFFELWKKTYKRWLDIYYDKRLKKGQKSTRTPRNVFLAKKKLMRAYGLRDAGYWLKLCAFRRDWIGYKRTFKNYLYAYAETNYKTTNPFTYRKKKYRFKHNIFGQRIYLQRKHLYRRKSRKYIRWFRTLVTGGYYYSPAHAQKTFFKAGYGKKAWITRRRARHVFKMKFVFIRYFSKRFGLKNRTAFLRKAEHIARKRGNKWLRYYREFESRLIRVLVLFGLSSNDEMAKSYISNNWVLINRKIFNDHDYKFIPRVKMGDLVSLSNSAAPYFIKKKFKFFKKRLRFYERMDEAKFIYSFFKKHFMEWMVPALYAINGPIIKYGLTALMSGPVVTNSKTYFRINKFIPFFNRTLFKIFVQRFSKKLN